MCFQSWVVYGLKIYMTEQIKHLIIFGYKAGFLNVGTIDILGAVLYVVGCLVYLASTV